LGLTENAGRENDGHENAGHEHDAPKMTAGGEIAEKSTVLTEITLQ